MSAHTPTPDSYSTLSQASYDWDSKWDELMGEVKAWQKDLANSFATGLSSSTAPKVAALRVSIPFANRSALWLSSMA